MGCIDCEVPAAAPGWGGGDAREREREEFGGVLTMRNRTSSWQIKQQKK